MLRIICITYKDENIKSVLWNHCHETPPILKDHTCLVERPTFRYSRKCALRTFKRSLVTGSVALKLRSFCHTAWAFKIVSHCSGMSRQVSVYLIELFTSHHVSWDTIYWLPIRGSFNTRYLLQYWYATHSSWHLPMPVHLYTYSTCIYGAAQHRMCSEVVLPVVTTKIYYTGSIKTLVSESSMQ